MKTINYSNRFIIWLSIFLCVCYYLVILSLNQVPQDEGDGLQHFFTSKDSWNDTTLFLNHWGKPFFILFSSAFAQLGFEGFVCFNILVFVMSCLTVRAILKHYDAPLLLQVLFPFVLISIPDYSNSIIGGMTEPFFGLLLIVMFWLVIKERFFWFAVICSFTPFARSEGMLVVIAAIPYLLLLKQWKYIPLLALGFIAYIIIGWMMIDQPLWYFENNPYSPISIYGSGPWNTYLVTAFEHLGLIPILFLPFALFGWLVWRSQSKKRTDLLHVLFFTGLYIGIIVIHSYLWAKGLRGALGLSRLATLGLLPFLTIQAIALGYVLKELHKLTHAFTAVIVLLLVRGELNDSTLPTIASPQQLSLKEAAIYLENNEQKVNKIYYFHPLIIYFQHRKNEEESKQYIHRFMHLDYDAMNTFKTGDLIVRDSRFGDREQGLHLYELEKYPWLIPVKHFYTSDLNPELDGEQKSVIIYQVMDKTKFDRHAWNKKQKTIVQKSHFTFHTKGMIKDEYYTVDKAFTSPRLLGSKEELLVTVKLKKSNDQPVFLIFNDEKGCYISIPITTKTSTVTLPFIKGNLKGQLFIHNPSMELYDLNLKTESWSQFIDSGLQSTK